METLQVARAEGIVTITLDRPAKKNAMNDQMWDELLATFREIADSSDDRVVVITGAAGEFCSGADLTGRSGNRHQLAAMRHVGDVASALHRLPQPTIASTAATAHAVWVKRERMDWLLWIDGDLITLPAVIVGAAGSAGGKTTCTGGAG